MSKSLTLLLVLVFLTASCVVVPLPVKAGSKTITVPDDYPTISEAIKNANNGDTIFIQRGLYEERQLIINKALSVIGEGAELTKIELDPPLIKTDVISWIDGKLTSVWLYDFSIKVEADDFKLSGFTINIPDDDLTGGNIKITGNRTQIVGNHIATPLSVNGSYWNIEENVLRNVGVYGSYSNMAGNTFLADVYVTGSYSNFTENNLSETLWAFGSYLNISSNNKGRIRLDGSFCIVYGNNAPGGIEVWGDGNVVARNFVDRADVGLAISGSNNVICANRITNCRDNSFVSGSPPPTSGVAIRVSGNNTFYANYVADNTWGADVNSFPEINEASTLYNNNFIGNTHQVAAVQGFPYGSDSFDNGKEGNYWSDYTGTDANGDGVGDTPYVIDDKRQDRYPLMAPFDIDSVTIELPDWAFPTNPSPDPQASEPSEPFPTALVVASIGSVAVVGLGLFAYFRKIKKNPYRSHIS